MYKSSPKRLLKDNPIENQIETFKLGEQYLKLQSEIIAKVSEFRKLPRFQVVGLEGEVSLRDVFENAVIGSDVNHFHLGKITAGRESLEQRAKEQKEMIQLMREQYNLNMVIENITGRPPSGETKLNKKRRLEEYERLEEQALKVLKSCKRLRGAEEQREEHASEAEPQEGRD